MIVEVLSRHSVHQHYDEMASTPETVDLLCSLVLLLKPQVIVESGTYHGHAAFAMAGLCQKLGVGHLWTADVEDYCAQTMPVAITALGLDSWITYYLGGYADMLACHDIQGIALAWLDASHQDNPKMRGEHLAMTRDRLAPHGLIVMDDLAGEWAQAASLRRKADFYLPFGRGLGFFQG